MANESRVTSIASPASTRLRQPAGSRSNSCQLIVLMTVLYVESVGGTLARWPQTRFADLRPYEKKFSPNRLISGPLSTSISPWTVVQQANRIVSS